VVSPRRHHRRSDAARKLDEDQVRRGVEGVQAWGDGEWTVRRIPGGAATKAYRCPGCDQEIAPGVAHVVVWPAEGDGAGGGGSAGGGGGFGGGGGGLADRRHWHNGCWRARERRGPIVQRSRNAPKYG
jgi:hypothetical protein